MRTSQNEYNNILNMRRAENDRRNQEAKNQIQQNIDTEQNQAQSAIDDNCKRVTRNYQLMIDTSKECGSAEQKLFKANEEEANFIEVKDELYPLEDVDESSTNVMELRRIAYYMLPIIDTIFAWFALKPIITAKVSDFNMLSTNITIAVGAIMAIVLGYLLSIISRLGVATISDDRSSMTTLNKIANACAMLILPLMYVIGELAFNGGNDWVYSGGFAFVSLIIQILLISGYKEQMKALKYFEKKKRNKAIVEKREAHSNAIKSNIAEIEKKIERSDASFRSAYQNFTDDFNSLVARFEDFKYRFGKSPRYQLNQMVIYLGNLFCFRRMALPMVYNGQYLDGMPNVQFANTLGGADNVLINDDFINIDYMLHRSNSDLSLAETINNLKQKQNINLNEKVDNSENNNYQDQSEDDDDSTSIW